MKNVKGIAHIAIQANDIEKLITFYKDALEFTVVYRWSLPQFNLKSAAMLKSSDGHTMLELFDSEADIAGQGRNRRPNDEFIKNALLHIAFNVENVEDAYQKAILCGATSCIPPSTFELGSVGNFVSNALVHSPNGEVIEFIKTDIF